MLGGFESAGIDAILERAAVGADLRAEELLQLAALLTAASALKRQITTCAAQMRDSLSPPSSAVGSPGSAEHEEENASLQPLEAIASGIDASLADTLAAEICRVVEESSGVATVKTSASGKLRDVRSKIASAQASARKACEAVENCVSVEALASGRIAARLAAGCGAPSGALVVGASSAGLIIEPLGAVQHNSTLVVALEDERREVNLILWEASRSVSQSHDPVQAAVAALAEIDAINVAGESDVAIKGLRQPVLLVFNEQKRKLAAEQQAPRNVGAAVAVKKVATKASKKKKSTASSSGKGEDDSSASDDDTHSSIIPVDYVVPTNKRVVAITGPNAGGKTAALKGLGLAILMARAGLYIPAYSAVVPWSANVLADIGDGQSLALSLSAFTSRLARFKEILEEAGRLALAAAQAGSLPDTVILLDELGTGTNPAEGAAIGEAILRALEPLAALVVCTSHAARLALLKYDTTSLGSASEEGNGEPPTEQRQSPFEAAAAELDEDLAPTYRLLWGVPGRSAALELAERVGLSNIIIERARELVSSGSKREGVAAASSVTAAARALEDLGSQLLAAETTSQELKVKIMQARKEADADTARGVRLRREAIMPYTIELSNLINQAERKAALKVRNAQANKAALEKQASAKTTSNFLKAVPVKQVKVGDSVSLKTFPNQTGEVISVGSDANDYFRVKLGLLTVKAKLSDVIAVNAKANTAKQKAPPLPPTGAKSRQKSGKGRKSKSEEKKKRPVRGKDNGEGPLDLSKLNRRL